MILFYSGAPSANQPQPSYLKSLGGKISSSKVSNNLVANLFSNISLLAQERGYVETRGIFLKNTLGTTVTAVTLYHTYPANPQIKLEWAAVTVPDKETMEQIASSEDTPYYGNFSEPSTSGTKITLASSMAIGDVIALWCRKTVLPNPAISIPDDQLEAYLAGLAKSETINVFIDWLP